MNSENENEFVQKMPPSICPYGLASLVSLEKLSQERNYFYFLIFISSTSFLVRTSPNKDCLLFFFSQQSEESFCLFVCFSRFDHPYRPSKEQCHRLPMFNNQQQQEQTRIPQHKWFFFSRKNNEI